MIKAFILVILMSQAGHTTFSFQEFSSKERCEVVRKELLDHVISEQIRLPRVLRCVEK